MLHKPCTHAWYVEAPHQALAYCQRKTGEKKPNVNMQIEMMRYKMDE